MIVALDIGNSFIKWKLWSLNGVAVGRGRAAHDEGMEALIAYLKQYPLHQLHICNVAEHGLENALRAAFADINITSFKSSKSCMGVLNAYQQADRLGADRFLASIEAYYHSGKKAICVLDLGTAATLDVVDDKGRHQGGYIVPGLSLMADSLQQSTEQIIVGDGIAVRAYGKNTTQAVKNGITAMLTAWIDQELDVFQAKYPQGVIYLTGGDAEQIMPLLKTKNINVCSDLLLDGLLRIAMHS